MLNTSGAGPYGEYTQAQVVAVENKLKSGAENFDKKCAPKCKELLGLLLKQSGTIGRHAGAKINYPDEHNRNRLAVAQEDFKTSKARLYQYVHKTRSRTN